MTGERSLNRDVGDFTVSNLTHQNDVRSLTQHGSENRGEAQSDRVADLNLIDAAEVVFHGIFSGDDLAIRSVQRVECRVERGGLARTGRPGDEEDAVGPLDDPFEDLKVVGFETDVGEADSNRIGTKHSKHDAFTVVGGTETDTEVDVHRFAA